MLLFTLLLAAADPALPTSMPQEPSKFPLVREIESIGGTGSTLLSFDIDKKGKVKNCAVLESSGSAYLDEGACKILTEKAKFLPTRNEKGKPVEVVGRQTRIRWNITDE